MKGLPAVSKRLSLILQFIQNFFLPLDDLLNRPRRNFFRSVSSFPSALWNICRNMSRQLISTACSVLKLLLSHSGHHGPVVSCWFSESLVRIYSASVSSWAFIFLNSCLPLSMLPLQLLYIQQLRLSWLPLLTLLGVVKYRPSWF